VGAWGALKNKYILALVAGLAAGGLYIYFSYKRLDRFEFDGEAAALLAVATAGVVICLLLSFEIARHPAQDLGELKEERGSLIFGLIFAIFLGVNTSLNYFSDLSGPSATEPASWIYRSWGEPGDCGAPLTIRRGANNRELVVESAGESEVRTIEGQPTGDSVETESGIYTRHEDGTMTSTVNGMHETRFTPCP